MATASMSRPLISSTSASSSTLSSGVSTWPVASSRSVSSKRRRRGTSGAGFSYNGSYSLGTRMRRSSSTSRKPRVVISAVRAPLPSRMALVATVEACRTSANAVPGMP